MHNITKLATLSHEVLFNAKHSYMLLLNDNCNESVDLTKLSFRHKLHSQTNLLRYAPDRSLNSLRSCPHTHGAEIARPAYLALETAVEQHLLQLVPEPVQELPHGGL